MRDTFSNPDVRPRTLISALVAGAGLALGASHAVADVTWNTQMGFALSSGGSTLQNNQFALTATGTYTFYVRAGIFNLAGLGTAQSNQGLNNWTAAVTASGLQPGETLG